jgi:large subunit ribosomal protein L9
VEIILTEDVPKLGRAGDVVRVTSGYGRNYLIPQGKAMLATRGRVTELAHKKRMVEERERKLVAEQQELAARLAAAEVTFAVQAGEEGKLFGSVTTADIVARLAEAGFEVDRRKVDLSEPIKQLGLHAISIRLHREVVCNITVKVEEASE